MLEKQLKTIETGGEEEKRTRRKVRKLAVVRGKGYFDDDGDIPSFIMKCWDREKRPENRTHACRIKTFQ